MAIKIGINGFGRIGRIVLRIMCENPETFDIRGINLRKADIDYMVYLLKYDSVFRNFPGMVEHAGGDLIVNGHKIKVYSESDAAMINWADSESEYIIESTGANNTTDKASRHFKGGAKKVILTAPAKDDATPTFVYGVNSDEYRPDMKVISNASCTTNCLAPLAYVIHKTFGIERGTEYALEQVYNIIDARYRSKKPLIVTTNLTLTDLKNPQDVAHARIYDRLRSMCSPICFAGENLRQQAAAQKTAKMRALMKSTT